MKLYLESDREDASPSMHHCVNPHRQCSELHRYCRHRADLKISSRQCPDTEFAMNFAPLVIMRGGVHDIYGHPDQLHDDLRQAPRS